MGALHLKDFPSKPVAKPHIYTGSCYAEVFATISVIEEGSLESETVTFCLNACFREALDEIPKKYNVAAPDWAK
jgi:hypothetical protein